MKNSEGWFVVEHPIISLLATIGALVIVSKIPAVRGIFSDLGEGALNGLGDDGEKNP